MAKDNHTIAGALVHGQQLIASCSDSALLDCQILLCFILKKERSYLFTWPEKQLSPTEYDQYKDLLSRRKLGEPIAYIVGFKEFWSLPFKVSPATLIPRPDTEVLVETVLELFQDKPQTRCLDLGTGTGAIALALASENPNWKIDAVDFSLEAVELAKLNAEKLELAQVNIYQSDWFKQISSGGEYDVIVSNPPYIDAEDENLTQGDVRFEPESALVAEEQGLADIKNIAQQAKNYLVNNGVIAFEHGFEQGTAVREVLSLLGYVKPQTVTDLNGHDRVSWAVFSNDSFK